MENKEVLSNEEIKTKGIENKESKGYCWCNCQQCGSMNHCGGFGCEG
ncbi:hypothetical protein [Tenacibaculum finnmarkense]|nr:hypothetical protein [Tenacibaculum finnmarkense]MBE7689043.1 hypothetical protein [Tenacibaculum finnmarkense genomovar ulcerans]MCD8411098.1 hypothetical protein [Tenacibaculum finnmarkense genomovar ulcerans]MCG8831458.1 hypothetical protein [Tenacibaculum finnmarkense]